MPLSGLKPEEEKLKDHFVVINHLEWNMNVSNVEGTFYSKPQI